jgi:RNA polymerase sigma-70 factor (ECF subfamily)
VWTKLSSFQNDKKFSTWLYAIATNLCLDKLKSLNCRCVLESIDEHINSLISGENADKKLLNSELSSIILSITNELTPKQKIVFTLRCIEELEIDEVIQITGMSADKIKSNLFLARKSIKQKLENYG